MRFNDRLPVPGEWIATCDANHPDCASHSDYTPTRLVDVGILNSSDNVRLVLTKTVQLTSKISYATLSHCWGTIPMSVSTTKATLEAHLAGFDIQALPKNFRDAIEIARALLIPYIWIDSLCIIQDDELDWRHEATQMASVYSSSKVTIAATSASDSTVGCFIDNSLSTSVTTVDLGLSEDGSTIKGYIRYPSHREGHFLDSPLHSRGWILQELVLSRRTLFFTSDQWYWSCRTTRCAEDGMMPPSFGFRTAEYLALPPRDPRRPRPTSDNRIDPSILAVYNLQDPNEASRTWWMWMMDFSKRRLTKMSDRYAALAGITTCYQRATGDRPILGLWESTLLRDLLWSISTSETHDLRLWCVAPAVVARYEREALEMRILRQRSSLEQLKDVPTWSCYAAQGLDLRRPRIPIGEVLDARTTFLGADIEWSGEPLTSSLLSSALHVYGPVRLVEIQKNGTVFPLGDVCGNECRGCQLGNKNGNGYVVDWDYYPPKDEVFWALQIGTWGTSSESQGVLILCQTGQPDEYRRQGLMDKPGQELCFRAANELYIKLV